MKVCCENKKLFAPPPPRLWITYFLNVYRVPIKEQFPNPILTRILHLYRAIILIDKVFVWRELIVQFARRSLMAPRWEVSVSPASPTKPTHTHKCTGCTPSWGWKQEQFLWPRDWDVFRSPRRDVLHVDCKHPVTPCR